MCSSQVLFSFNMKTFAKFNKKIRKMSRVSFCGKFLHSGDQKIQVIHFKFLKQNMATCHHILRKKSGFDIFGPYVSGGPQTKAGIFNFFSYSHL
jgi:hypothetical protein